MRPETVFQWATLPEPAARLAATFAPRLAAEVLLSHAPPLHGAALRFGAASNVWITNPTWKDAAAAPASDAPERRVWPIEPDAPLPLGPGTTTRDALLAELELPADARLALTVGPLIHEKRIDDLFWAIDQVSCVRDDCYQLIVGTGPDRARLARYAACYHVTDRVRFLGYRPDLYDIYRAVDFYATADRTERVSMALLEARAAGLPIVACGASGARHALAGAVNVRYVAPKYVAEYSAAFLRTLERLDAKANI
ncbi:MAG: glycosyltransferase [Pirellulales bacterium]